MMSSSTISTDSKPDAGFWRRERSQGTTSSGTSFDARASFEAHWSVVVASREGGVFARLQLDAERKETLGPRALGSIDGQSLLIGCKHR